ncbi:hypothetical protein [Herbiconiux sp. UC225_62]|uniref:hypothetical protein n=1 Tax=Herbiconiux sp. UC225_62 TaxID=3350168 RepID=UPI0036D43D93
MAGLLDKPKHALQLQKFVLTGGSLGQRKPIADGERVTLRCNIQPLDSAERISRGLQLEVTRRISIRRWPGDYLSRVYFEGFEWETVGEPEHFAMGVRTPHWVIIVKRGARDGAGL